MKKILIYGVVPPVIFIILFLLFGRPWTLKEYNFLKAENTSSCGNVAGNLTTDGVIELEKGWIVGPPYRLGVWIEPKSNLSDSTASISNIEIIDLDTKQIIKLKGSFKKNINDTFSLSEKLDLPFHNHLLKFHLQVINGNNILNEDISLLFKTKYEERKLNKYFELWAHG